MRLSVVEKRLTKLIMTYTKQVTSTFSEAFAPEERKNTKADGGEETSGIQVT